MKRKINRKIVDPKGYKESNKENFTDVKVIPSNQITMKDVKSTILGIVLDGQGQAQGFEFMKPGEDYTFEGAEAVVEIPKYQMAGVVNNPFTYQNPLEYKSPFGNTPNPVAGAGSNMGTATTAAAQATRAPQAVPGTPPGFSGGSYEELQAYINQLQSGANPGGTPPYLEPGTVVPTATPTAPTYNFSNDSLIPPTEAPNLGTQAAPVNPWADDPAYRAAQNELATNGAGEAASPQMSAADTDDVLTQVKTQSGGAGNFQFFNPYGGVDIPTSAFTLGASIEDGNAFGIVSSGLKLATGLARNTLSGVGMAKRQRTVMNDYRQQQRDYVTGVNNTQYMAEGGRMEKVLTGEYMFGMDEVNPIAQANAEIETGEYIQHPNQEIQQAEGDTHEQGGMDVVLEEGTKILSDHLKIGGATAKDFRDRFDIEVKATDTYATVLDKFNRKSGLAKIVKEQEEVVKNMDKQQKETKDEESLGLNMQYLSGKMKELEDKKKPLEQARKILFEAAYTSQEKAKPKGERDEEVFQDGGQLQELAAKYGIAPERISELMSDLPKYQAGGEYTPAQRRERFRDFYRQAKTLGYEGDANPNATNLDAEAGKLQTWMTQNYPEVVAEYAKGVDMTAKGVDILKQSNPEIFSEAGIPANKPSASYTPEEKAVLKRQLEAKGLSTDDFWKEQFQDNRWSYRYPAVPLEGLVQAQPKSGVVPTLPVTPDITAVESTTVADVVADPISPSAEVVQEETNYDRMGVFLMPEQNPLPPSSLQPHLKVNRRFDRINPNLISPEQNLEEIRRQEATAVETINQLPDSQRAAALANLNANTQQNINKAISETARVNSQIQTQADAQNAQTQRMEENAAAQDALSYEQRQLTALAKTQFDINNFYNTQQANNVRNFNTINNLNLANAMYDDFQFTGAGIEKTSEDIEFLNPVRRAQALSEEKKKVTKKKFGGRFQK